MKYIIKESQYVHLLENLEKNKKFLTNLMGIDFTGNIEQITSSYDVPMSFDEGVGPELIKRWLNYWGPMYLVNIKGKKYLYQDRGDFEMFLDEKGFDYVDNEILEELGIDVMGLRFSDIIDMYFNEEESLNESVIIEETNKSLKLLEKYYDIEGDGATYFGKNKIQTLVTFFPKNYDNEMTREAGSSICSWLFEPPYNLIRKHMTLPGESFIPLMGYIGNGEDLKNYLEKIHRKEAEKFIVRLKHRDLNPLS